MADRNLLFGILALQMDFITRDQLVAAMNFWALHKQQPLGQVLQEQGALSAERRQLLDALVAEHLKQHGGDAQKSLASLQPAAVARRELEQIRDTDVAASLVHVPATSSTDQYATVASTQVAPGESRFHILRAHAKGGLGEVFVARDLELEREVALKQIQHGHSENLDSRNRFVLEAEITGGLEHPGIVPVYGLGHYADGRPYYAMRFIRGMSLKHAIERYHKAGAAKDDPGQRSIEYRDLLGRFVDVCNAIEYAHCRRVLHRDLKPDNVMLGPYGETLVVDWGLAKPLGQPEVAHSSGERPLMPASASGSVATLMGSTLGTPAFMSPEQAQGRLDELGPAADIYSLGATLYCLLTGVPPFTDRAIDELMRKVERGDFVPPRQKQPAVAPALDAICRKAMALRPEDRYATARALAADIEHWLADEPVTVYREPWAARAARWGRRHRTQLAAVAALLVTAVVALTVSTLLIWREQARTEVQRRQADANFQIALKAVDDMLTEVAQEQLAAEPRMETKRLALLTQARNYYVQFLEQKSDDPALREATAQAHRRLGDIARLLGKYDEARTAYSAADDLFEQLLRERPGDSELRRQLAESLTYLGEVHRLTSQPKAAADAYLRAQELDQALADQFRDRPTHRKELARTYYNLGILWKDTSRPNDAKQATEKSIAILKALVDENPKTREYAQHLARGYLNLGPILRALGQPEAAERAYLDAIRLQKVLAGADPANPDYRHEQAITYNNLGYLQREERRPAEATASFRRAVELFDRLAVQFPGVPMYRKELANSQNNLAIVLAHAGDQPAAETAWRGARDLFAGLVEAYPGTADYLGDLGMTVGNLGWLELQRKNFAGARDQLLKSLGHVDGALKANPDHPVYRRARRDQLGYLAEALLGLGDHVGAAERASAMTTVFPEQGKQRVVAASLLARCVARARKDASRPDAERQELAGRYAEQAVEQLQQAHAQGALDAAALQSEEFTLLRNREDFRALAARLKP